MQPEEKFLFARPGGSPILSVMSIAYHIPLHLSLHPVRSGCFAFVAILLDCELVLPSTHLCIPLGGITPLRVGYAEYRQKGGEEKTVHGNI